MESCARCGRSAEAWRGVGTLAARFDLVPEPLDVVLEKLHAVDEAAVGPQRVLLHDLFQRYQLHHVHGARIGKLIVAGVQVDDDSLTMTIRQKLQNWRVAY